MLELPASFFMPWTVGEARILSVWRECLLLFAKNPDSRNNVGSSFPRKSGKNRLPVNGRGVFPTLVGVSQIL